MRRARNLAAALLTVFALDLVCAPALAAGGITINPVRLELAPGARAVSLKLGNEQDSAHRYQVEALRWTQQDGADRYAPAPELVVNPALFELQPGHTQIVRAGFRGGAPAQAQETAYRLFFQELPEPERSAAPNQLQVLLRIGIPLFVLPDAPGGAQAQWALDAGAVPALEVHNAGSRHLRLDRLSLLDGQDRPHPLAGLRYVLAGQTQRWELPSGLRPPLRLTAVSPAGPIDVALHPR